VGKAAGWGHQARRAVSAVACSSAGRDRKRGGAWGPGASV